MAQKSETTHMNGEGRLCDLHEARLELVERADGMIESFGELFIEERFQPTCPLPGFESARMERFTRADFPRFLLDFDCFDAKALSADTLKRDLQQLCALVEAQPEKFEQLVRHLDDPDDFGDLAEELGLTEEAFVKAGGGFIQWIIVIVAAVVLTGCGDPTCGAIHRLDGQRCPRKQGHKGKHRDRAGHRY